VGFGQTIFNCSRSSLTYLSIQIRIIYRLAEFSRGNGPSNPLPYHESYFYIFEAVPMMLAIAILNITHPGTAPRGPDSELPPSQLCKCCCIKRKAKKSGHVEIAGEEMVGMKGVP